MKNKHSCKSLVRYEILDKQYIKYLTKSNVPHKNYVRLTETGCGHINTEKKLVTLSFLRNFSRFYFGHDNKHLQCVCAVTCSGKQHGFRIRNLCIKILLFLIKVVCLKLFIKLNLFIIKKLQTLT